MALYLNLLYRGSVDGFAASDFHRKCDNKGPTLTVVETIKNKKFGGYAALDWKSGINRLLTNYRGYQKISFRRTLSI